MEGRRKQKRNRRFLRFHESRGHLLVQIDPFNCVLLCIRAGCGDNVFYVVFHQLLRLLLENTNLVVTRETILQVVWGTDISVESRTVDMHIRTLRKKLGDAGKYICTVRKVGYKLTDEEEAGEE